MNRRALLAAVAGALVARPAAAYVPYEAAIRDAAARHGADPETLIALMLCESEGNPWAQGDANIDGSGRDSGLFQYSPATWSEMTGYMGISADIWDPHAQIEVTAWAVAHGYGCRWVCMRCGNF